MSSQLRPILIFLLIVGCADPQSTAQTAEKPSEKNNGGSYQYEPPPETEPPVGNAEDVLSEDTPLNHETDTKDTTPEKPTEIPRSCPENHTCVSTFPFTDTNNTALSTLSQINSYSCKPGANESGTEVVYQIKVQEAGFLSAAVYPAEGVDVDVHILSALDGESCVSRGDIHAGSDISAGTWFVVIDTFVDTTGPLAGGFEVDIGFVVPSQGSCSLENGIMKRVGDAGNHLKMPAKGPVVKEAHLVTNEEPAPYPTTAEEELAEHYLLAQYTTGFVMARSQYWAPLEGGNFYGAGISSPTLFPALDEHWYVCMYWKKESRPKRGTKMILRLPDSNRAVVVAAGYETGPGNLNNIGGTTEETHFYLGTGHKSILELGIATDQSLPFGPRTCTTENP